jgi:hypothetical protein
MNRPVVQARRGIALVITLIMLSVVTITAVAFLAVSRRERGAVAASGEQIGAKYAADAALNRVKAEVASRIHASGNRSAFGFIVSTNYSSASFDPDKAYIGTGNRSFLTNVSYQLQGGGAFTVDNYESMLGNLYYDARPPVFVSTNSDRKLPLDFRFYLDVNRNGRFETNGWQQPRDASDRPIQGSALEFMVGDPEWIGILEHPEAPHSGTNLFQSRFAYLVLPAGRGMDVNFIHNQAKSPQGTNQIATSFMRDQGVGSWELNLAGFLSDLNTNAWPVTDVSYVYQPFQNQFNKGLAFTDASRFLLARRQFASADRAPSTARAFFQTEAGNNDPTPVQTVFQAKTNAVDWYSDGMNTGGTSSAIRTLNDIRNTPLGNDDPKNVWPGGDYTNSFTDFGQFFSSVLGIDVQRKLAGVDGNTQSPSRSYDRYTFQRLLAQLGTDGSDARFETGFQTNLINTQVSSNDPQYNPDGFYRRAKLNLNFRQDDPNGDKVTSASVAPFTAWEPLNWFTNAAHRMLLTEFPYGLPRKVSSIDSIPGLPVNGYTTNFNTNPRQVYQTNAYTAQLHRLLQVSANIFDYATNRVTDYLGNPNQSFPYLPSVFLPVLYRESNPRFDSKIVDPKVARLARFDAVTNNAVRVLQQPWVDLEDPAFTATFAPGFNADGRPDARNSAQDNLLAPNSLKRALYVDVPMVIGAKQGYPNFNEGFWQSAVRVTRRLFVTKPSAQSVIAQPTLPFGKPPFKTEVQYRFQITNHFSVEAWNSYHSNFYAKGFPRSVRLVATNVLSFGLFHDGATNGIDQAILSSVKGLPLNNNFTRVGNYLVMATNIDLGANQWSPDTFIRVLNDQLRYDFTYTDGQFQDLSQGTNSNYRGNVDLSKPPVLHLFVTNRLMYAMIDRTTGAMLDYVNLKSVVVETNLLRFFGVAQGPLVNFIGGGDQPVAQGRMPDMWDTNAFNVVGPTRGMRNQMGVSLGQVLVPNTLWTDPLGNPLGADQIRDAINGFNYFLYGQFATGQWALPSDAKGGKALRDSIIARYGTLTNMQVGFNPSPTVYLTDRLQANDPLVHYTREDLAPGYSLYCDSGDYSEVPGPDGRLSSLTDGFQLTTNSVADLTGKSLTDKARFRGVIAWAPWGHSPLLRLKADVASDYNLYYKDPQITNSESWSFPTNASSQYPGIGFLGRVHRGTPWQTLYLKSPPLVTNGVGQIQLMQSGTLGDRFRGNPTWVAWSGSPATHPVNDWKLLDLFTTAINDNAARGLMSVNQTNIASWSALLSGVSLLDTSSSVKKPQPFELRPNSEELRRILRGYTNSFKGTNTIVPGLLQAMTGTNAAVESTVSKVYKIPVLSLVRSNVFYPGGTFNNLGSILSVPTLSDRAPFLFDHTRVDWTQASSRQMTDEVVERLPQQILSLLRADEPRVVVYSYGQSLKPALNSLVTKPGFYYGLCTNYQITGEYVTKTTLRFDGSPGNLRTVVEDHRVLYPSN